MTMREAARYAQSGTTSAEGASKPSFELSSDDLELELEVSSSSSSES